MATIGAIGFEGRWDYGAIGAVTNLAARLCAEAKPSQILISLRVANDTEDLIETEPLGALTLKGPAKPVPTFNVIGGKAREARRRRLRQAAEGLEAEPDGVFPLPACEP